MIAGAVAGGIGALKSGFQRRKEAGNEGYKDLFKGEANRFRDGILDHPEHGDISTPDKNGMPEEGPFLLHFKYAHHPVEQALDNIFKLDGQPVGRAAEECQEQEKSEDANSEKHQECSQA